MNSYKVNINIKIILFFISIALCTYILDKLNILNRGRYMSYLICAFIVYNIIRFFFKSVYKITFTRKRVVLNKYEILFLCL